MDHEPDRREIADLLVRYCVYLDRMELDALAGLFTPECRVEYGPDQRLQSAGACALAASLQRMWRWARTSHHLSNIVVEFDAAAAARATSYVLAWHQRPDGSTATVYGQYRDRLVRRDGRWLIDERRMLMNGCDAGFKLDLYPAERRPPPDGWIAPDLDRR
ncbi:MAG: nuclear transport factor 2 family protein [Gammaproteobacteria bacterium]|nr:nuclear transport factor 2 family protein [Gammaproteobacteria bacterium]MDH4255364.1 nuclear transport factor 2 family protein [Gammaproteobacteria bacterium]MDH5311510.1 nuclear transport factor 2 family protein [Gammaproteobacteria bacterium]